MLFVLVDPGIGKTALNLEKDKEGKTSTQFDDS